MIDRQRLLMLLGAGHLLLAALSAAHLNILPRDSPPARVVGWYAAMTGTDAGFAFFAPGVGSPTRATFVMTDASGRTWTDTLAPDVNREARLRIGSILFTAAEPQVRDALTASWAGKMLARHPEARSVRVCLEVLEMPPMTAHREGARSEWLPVYEISFHRDTDIAQNTER